MGFRTGYRTKIDHIGINYKTGLNDIYGTKLFFKRYNIEKRDSELVTELNI